MLRGVVNNFLSHGFTRMNTDLVLSVSIRVIGGQNFLINFKADIHYRSDVFLE
jgi:hypothetical protein